MTEMDDQYPIIYCLPGLGADHRLFAEFKPNQIQVKCIDYIEPLSSDESISNYALRLSKGIDSSKPFFLMGISLGGIMATEIAHHLTPQGIVYLSSIKSSAEKSKILQAGNFLPIPGFKFIKSMLPKGRKYFKSDKAFDLFSVMLDNTSDLFGEWAIHAIIHWKQLQPEVPFLHINGSKDEIFPPSHIKNVTIIEGERHDMTFNQWDKLNPLINSWLTRFKL